ncbi:unnamed protein product [Haemonchus placei]|uniref:ACT domain-containing protein n=1 Tax=Haemonchus placei TaxID=6290 RepID=A0A0N4XB22_HAEPC|nr:unnamed protein product [Haemonchus placei]
MSIIACSGERASEDCSKPCLSSVVVLISVNGAVSTFLTKLVVSLKGTGSAVVIEEPSDSAAVVSVVMFTSVDGFVEEGASELLNAIDGFRR